MHRRLGLKKHIGLHTQRNAEFIDRERKIVSIDGEEVAYDILLINTGATNKITPIPGLKGDRVHYLTTELKYAERLRGVIAQGKQAVILGGGIISLEMADTLIDNGYSSVSVVISSDHLFSQQLDNDMATKLVSIIQDRGVDLYVSTSVLKAESNEKNITLFFQIIRLLTRIGYLSQRVSNQMWN